MQLLLERRTRSSKRVYVSILFAFFVGTELCLSRAVLAHEDPASEAQHISEALWNRPNDLLLYGRRAELFRQLGAYDDALRDAVRMRSLSPASLDGILMEGLVLTDAGRYAEALPVLNDYVGRGGVAPAAFVRRARILTDKQELEAAIRDYDSALVRSDDIDIYLARADLQLRRGEREAAAIGFANGLKRTQAVTLRRKLAELELQRGNAAAVPALVAPALAQAPNKTSWLLLRARAYADLGDASRAERDRRQALVDAERLVRKRDTPLALMQRARARAALLDIMGARADAKAALARAPQSPEMQAGWREVESIAAAARTDPARRRP